MTPLESVQRIYAAFGRGDIPAILEMLADDVAWEAWADNSAQKAGVPWLEPRTGKAGAGEFFRIIGQFQVHGFQVLSIMAGEREVAAECVFEGTPPGGRRFRDEEMHLWTFGPDGKVVRFRHYTDTAKHIAAAGSSVTSART
jgi:ketosteroid isomerase-like protein